MAFNFDTPPNRRNSESVKWNRYDEDMLPMWVADMDFRSPEPVVEALRQRVDHGIWVSPPPGKSQRIRCGVAGPAPRLGGDPG